MPRSAPSRRAVICSLLLAGCVSATLGRAAPPPAPVTVFAAGESLGHLEPCNCVEGMLGGFPRRLAMLERLRDADAQQLVVDTGDLTGLGQQQPRLLEAKTRAALELLARAGSLVAVGEHDLRLGVARLRELAQAAGVILLNANLCDPASGEPAFTARHELWLGQDRLVVTAVLDPELGDPSGALELVDPREALDRVLGEEETPSRRLVLFHGTRERAREVLSGLAIDAVICGHERSRDLRPLERWGGIWAVETVRDARSLLRLELDGERTRAQRLPLDGHVPDHEWARERVDAYYDEVRGLPEPPRRVIREGGAYVGAATCMGCHAEAAEVFLGSKHHGAQERVSAAQPTKADLPECVRCHVTGYGYRSGFESLADTPHLGEVGCESCHGVGGNHAVAPPDEKKGYGLRAGFPESWRALCLRCHDPSNSPDFDFQRYLERIRHWEPR